jgi:DNA-binding transcriptional LysR family regulator
MSHPLDSRALQMFVAVAQCLNFRQAAEQLHMAQPPLSRAIQQLEQRAGVRLFERDTRGVALTEAAVQLLPKAQRILALLDEARGVLAQHQAQPVLRLGLTTAVEQGAFRAFADALQAALPELRVQASFQSSPRLVAALRTQRLDAALIALPTKTFELQPLPLNRQPMLVALPARHALARRRLLSLSDLRDQTVFGFERARQPAFFDHCHAVFQRHGFAPRFEREPLDHHVLLADIAAGRGMALLPASFAALGLAGVAYRKLREGDELALGLGLLLSARAHPSFKRLSALAGKTFA